MYQCTCIDIGVTILYIVKPSGTIQFKAIIGKNTIKIEPEKPNAIGCVCNYIV